MGQFSRVPFRAQIHLVIRVCLQGVNPMVRNRIHVAICIGILIAIAATGCGRSPKQRLVGKWQGAIEFDEQAVQKQREKVSKNVIAKAFLEKAIEGFESGTVNIELKADNSFTLTVEIGPFKRASFGKWEVVSAIGNLVVVRLIDQNHRVEQVSLKFVDNNTFTMDIIGKDAQDLAVFRCNRVQMKG